MRAYYKPSFCVLKLVHDVKEQNKKLAAITAAAFALPGMMPKSVIAQTIPEEYESSYRYSNYREGGSGEVDADGNAVPRYDIDIHQVALVAPVSSRLVFTVDAGTERMSQAVST